MLLPGLAGQPGQWRWLATELEARGHRCHPLALRVGRWPDQVEAVARAVDDAGEPVVVVGHSLGGLLARAFATSHPGAAAGLATIGAPTPEWGAPWFDQVGHVDGGEFVVDDLDRWMEMAFPGCPDELRALVWRAPLPLGPPPPCDAPGGEPRVALVCESDAAVPYDVQHASARQWAAPVASVPGGHSPHVRHPALVATLLLNWLTPGGA